MGAWSAECVAAAPLFVGVEGFVGQGMHDCPGDICMTGSVGARCAVGDLATASGAALDRQERLSDVIPAGIPLDPAALNRVLCLKHQSVFGFEAVVD